MFIHLAIFLDYDLAPAYSPMRKLVTKVPGVAQLSKGWNVRRRPHVLLHDPSQEVQEGE